MKLKYKPKISEAELQELYTETIRHWKEDIINSGKVVTRPSCAICKFFHFDCSSCFLQNKRLSPLLHGNICLPSVLLASAGGVRVGYSQTYPTKKAAAEAALKRIKIRFKQFAKEMGYQLKEVK